jgi:hypothetical protein
MLSVGISNQTMLAEERAFAFLGLVLVFVAIIIFLSFSLIG